MIEIQNREKINNPDLIIWAKKYQSKNHLKSIKSRDTKSGDIKALVYESRNGLQVGIKNIVKIQVILEENDLEDVIDIAGVSEKKLENGSSVYENTHLSDKTCKEYLCESIKCLENLLDKYFGFNNEPEDAILSDIQEISLKKELTETQRTTLVEARIGQGKFKRNVINAWGGEVCALTGINIPELLIASHIKPWRNSDDGERLDGTNGIILSANIDKLFDRYLITFRKKDGEYKVEVSQTLAEFDCEQLGVFNGMCLQEKIHNESSRERFEGYLLIHNKVFAEKEMERT